MTQVNVQSIRRKEQIYNDTKIVLYETVDSKTFDINTETAMYPDEFYNYVSDLQEQLAEGKIDKIIIQRIE